VKDDFPQIWVPSWENRICGSCCGTGTAWCRVRTRIMNQLLALALNEDCAVRRGCGGEHGRGNWSRFGWLHGPAGDAAICWSVDRTEPTIAELSQAIEQEQKVPRSPQRLMTHPGVGPLTALALC